MSTTYGSCALQFPNNYVLIDTEEMEYLSGGDFYISNANLKSVLLACALNPVAAVFVAVGYYKICTTLVGAMSAIGAKFGALAGAAGAVVGACIGALSAAAVAGTIFDAIVQGKGISIGWKKIMNTVPYGVDISVQ